MLGALDNKERKRQHRWEQKNRWMAHYELKYGVVPVEVASHSTSNNSSDPVVLKAKCRFCECFGREVGGVRALPSSSTGGGKHGDHDAREDAFALTGAPQDGDDSAVMTAGIHLGGGGTGPPPSKRRKKRQTLKVFGPNFRTDNLESHLSREHPVKWREYERLRDVEKTDFFPDVPVFKELMGTNVHQNGAAALLANTGGSMQQQQQQQQHGIAVTHPVPPAAMGNNSTTTPGAFGSNASAISSSFSPGGLMGNSSNGSSSKTLSSMTDKLTAKCFVPLRVMHMVDQLLSNRASKASSLSLDVDANDSESMASSWWHQFVRVDDQFDGTTLPMLPVDLKNAATSGEMYALSIKSEPLFFFIVDAFSAGLSLDATLAMVHSAQRFLVDPLHFGTIVLTDIIESVRNLVSLNLSGIALLTSFTWGYSVLLHFVTRHSTGYLDIRLQLAVNDEIHDLHVLAVPVDAQKHSAEAVNTLVIKVLTALDACAIEKIIGVTIDGDPFHMEKYKHVGVLLRKEVAAATNNAAFYVIHSGTYHVNMVIEELLEICQAEFGVLTTLTDIESLCKLNSSLFAAMGPEPTRATSAHWIEVYNLCEWLVMHRETLTKWCHDQNELHHLPGNTFWVIVFLLRDLLKDVYAVYVKCLEHSISFTDIQRHLRELIFHLRLKFTMKAVASSSSSSDTAATPMAPSGVEGSSSSEVTPENSSVDSESLVAASAISASQFLDLSEFTYQDFVNAIIPLDLFMYEAFQLKSIDGVGENERMHIYERFNALIFLLITKFQGVVSVSADSSSGVSENSTNGSFPEFHQYTTDIPPSTPYELITMNNLTFMELLNSQQFRVRSKWTGKALTMITEERNRMIADFSLRGAFHDAVSFSAKQQQQGSFSFRDAWKITSVQFPSLCNFAIVFGSLLTVSKDENVSVKEKAQSVSNVLLEAQLHARQFYKVNSLRKHVDTVV